MDKESFTYVLRPLVSAQECVHDFLRENLPSLEEAVESMEKKRGTLLIERDEFTMDALLSFTRMAENNRLSNVSKETSLPGGGIIPTTVNATEEVENSNLKILRPSLFEEGVWPLVWAQFERDISRETLLIDGTPCDDAKIALQQIENLLKNAYDEQPSRIISSSSNRNNFNESWGIKGFTSKIATTVWDVYGKVRLAYDEMIKKNEISEALRLAILTAQQTVLALPVELLHAQFCTPSHSESKAVYIGEPHVKKDKNGKEIDNNYIENEIKRRMIVRIERRSRGNRLPFVRVEKSLQAFTVDESGNHSTKLQLYIIIEINLFTKDHVQLDWEWRSP